jgi:soluble lytic murein transglycosylase-like protein
MICALLVLPTDAHFLGSPIFAAARVPAKKLDTALLERLASSLAEQVPSDEKFDAQVWLVATEARLMRYVKDAPTRLRILRNVYTEANRQALDPDLVLAVMHVESYFDPFAISRVGAQGLMQVMPFWRGELGREQDNLTHIETNIRYGTTILAHYLERSNGDLVDALGRYNGSRGRLKYPELVVDRWRRFWQNRNLADQPELQQSCADYRLKACYSR